MLLRSSSTPILGSLNSYLASLPETLKEVDAEWDSSPVCFKSGSSRSLACHSPASAFYSSTSLHGSQHAPAADESFSLGDGSWEYERDLVSRPRVRRAQSENDLASLGNGVACQYAANSLLGSSSDESDNRRESSSTLHRQWSKRLSLMRQSYANPQLHHRSYGLEREDSILEESDYFPLLPADESQEHPSFEADVRGISTLSTLKDSGIGLNERNARVTELDEAHNVPEASVFVNTCEHTAVAQAEPSVSGRGTDRFLMDDGEFYTSFNVSASGLPVVCNAKGCRPLYESEKLNPLYIAGGLGFGMGGGHHGGGNSGHGGGFGADSNSTEAYYKKLLQEDPENPLVLRNFARFLKEVRHEYERAEEYYHRAILAEPGDGDVLSQYAKLLWDVHKDQDRAESYYEQAVQAAPEDSYVLASYASFLWDSEDNEHNQPSCPQPLSTITGAAHGPARMVASA